MTNKNKSSLNRWTPRLHAAAYSAIAILTAVLLKHFQIDRDYLAVIAVLLILKPNTSSIRKLQMALGITAGALLSFGASVLIPSILAKMCMVTVGAAFTPWAEKKSQLIFSALLSTVMLLILNLAADNYHQDPQLAILRLKAVLCGVAVAFVALVILKLPTLFSNRDPLNRPS